jgi:hypothetical protein
MLAA